MNNNAQYHAYVIETLMKDAKKTRCVQPEQYKYAECNCDDCKFLDRIEHVRSEIQEQEEE